MKGWEYLWAYCQLRLHGYSPSEAMETLKKIKQELGEGE